MDAVLLNIIIIIIITIKNLIQNLGQLKARCDLKYFL